jgi:hypothetical protein
MNDYKFISDDDAIDLDDLDKIDKTLFEKEKQEHEEMVLKFIRDDYIESLRENYDADENLFTIVEELFEESEDQEKLIKILDSL